MLVAPGDEVPRATQLLRQLALGVLSAPMLDHRRVLGRLGQLVDLGCGDLEDDGPGEEITNLRGIHESMPSRPNSYVDDDAVEDRRRVVRQDVLQRADLFAISADDVDAGVNLKERSTFAVLHARSIRHGRPGGLAPRALSACETAPTNRGHTERTFDAACARVYGTVFAATIAHGRKARGRRAVDLLIAATAIANQLPLYARNPRDLTASTTWSRSSTHALPEPVPCHESTFQPCG